MNPARACAVKAESAQHAIATLKGAGPPGTSRSHMPSLAWRRSAAPLVYAALALWLHRHLVVAPSTRVYDQWVIGHDSLLHVWALAWGQHALWTDPAHVFDGPIFFPHRGALLFSDHLLGLSLLLAPFRLLTDDVVLLHNLVVIASPFLNAMAMFALARHLTGDRIGAFAAGIAYAFVPFRADADLNQVQMLVAWWAPLLFLGAIRALETGRRRWAALAGVSLFLQGMTGIYLTAFVLPFLALAHVWWLRPFPPRAHRRGWIRLLAAEAAAALALAPTALAYRYVQASLGTARSPVLNALLSIPPSRLNGHLALASLALPVVAAIVWRRAVPFPWRRDFPLALALALGGTVLAMGPVIALPEPAGRILGPYALFLGLPGFTALRAPGRMLHVATLGIALLTAGGVAAMRRRLPFVPAVGATALVLGGFAWQAWPGPTMLGDDAATTHADATIVADAPTSPPGSPHDWIRRERITTPLAEIPFGASARAEQIYTYRAISHWAPMANGNMGVKPALHGYLTRRLRSFPDDGTVGDLVSLGIRHVIVHEAELRPARRQAVHEAATSPEATLIERHRHGTDVVYALAPDAEPRTVELGPAQARDRWTVTTSENREDAPRIVDASPTTVWSNWGALERALRPWWAPQPFLRTWAEFIQRQPARVTVDLGTPVSLAAVSLALPGADPDVLALLMLDLSDDGTTWHTTTAPLLAIPNVGRVVTHGAEGRYAFVFPEPVTTRHLRLRVIGLEWRLGDLAVHPAR